uniref:Homing endonuclease n=1 Tax=Chlorella vulgaris TaxID=3077 RepID=A0A650ANL4_CHLVU|nr:homing endonuclease [Chlorella vulgaris]QGN75010.1 homing endonuclease [Chlorella vulgaris]
MNKIMKKIPKSQAYYITGFSDGEGSLNTSFRKRDDFLLGWKITPVFNISQKQRDILDLIQSTLSCGTIRYRNDGVWVYEVENQKSLREIIIPFFEKNPFLSQKKKADFHRFKQILAIQDSCLSLCLNDLVIICHLLDGIESKSKRKFTNQEILERATIFWEKNQDKILKKNQKLRILRDYTPNI